MENMTLNNVAMAALLNETWPALNSPTVHGTSTIGVIILSILGVSLALLILLYCGLPVIGFVSYGIAPLSYAAMWMSSIGNVAAGSLFSLLQKFAMGGISLFTVLPATVPFVALVVGAFVAIVWLLQAWKSGEIHVPAWLVDSWDSATAWVLHAWNSGDMLGWWHSAVAWLLQLWNSVTAWLPQLWNSVTAWLHHLWDSIPVHHKWKILYT